VLTSQRLQHIRIFIDYLHNCIWFIPTWRPLSKFMILGIDRQIGLPNQVAYLKGLQFYLLIISSSNSDFVLLNFFQSLKPFVGNLINVVHNQIMIIDSGQLILLSQPISSQIHLYESNDFLTINKLKRGALSSTMSRYVMNQQCLR
jgi:hypothetical protein